MGRNSRGKSARAVGCVGKKKTILGYILYQPKHDDFLTVLRQTEDVVQIGWCKHPSGAKVFKDLSSIEAKAGELMADREIGYELKICKLTDTVDRYKVEEIAVIAKT